jgi:hypothetical protein
MLVCKEWVWIGYEDTEITVNNLLEIIQDNSDCGNIIYRNKELLIKRLTIKRINEEYIEVRPTIKRRNLVDFVDELLQFDLDMLCLVNIDRICEKDYILKRVGNVMEISRV